MEGLGSLTSVLACGCDGQPPTPGPAGERKEAPRRLGGGDGLFYGNFFLFQKLITKGSMKSRIKTNSCDCDLSFNPGVLPSHHSSCDATLNTIKPSFFAVSATEAEVKHTPALKFAHFWEALRFEILNCLSCSKTESVI